MQGVHGHPLPYASSKVSLLVSCLGGAKRVSSLNPGAKILLPEANDDRVRSAVDYVMGGSGRR
jgi:hypothetical protein